MKCSARKVLFPLGRSTDFSLLAVLRRAQIGCARRNGLGALVRMASGSPGKRAESRIEAAGKARGALGRWCAAAGALGLARLCSQPPLHMQRGSLAARGGSSAESGKPAKGGAGRAGAGLGSPRCREGRDPGSPSHSHPPLCPLHLQCSLVQLSTSKQVNSLCGAWCCLTCMQGPEDRDLVGVWASGGGRHGSFGAVNCVLEAAWWC